VIGTGEESVGNSEYETELRRRTRLTRGGSWFALLVSGVTILAAMLFYHYTGPGPTSPGCIAAGAVTCQRELVSNGLFGTGLGSPVPGNFGSSSPWATAYWVISIFIGICAVVSFYWMRSRKIGTAGRIWPIVTIGLGALVLGVASRDWEALAPSQLTIRGMQALLVIALGLIALAIVDRSWSFSIFVAGFFGLAVTSCLYNVVNLFQRFGIGPDWAANDQTLPNLILPGIYLLIGGAAFWIVRHWRFRAEPSKLFPTLA
jgi:hypothetical protein